MQYEQGAPAPASVPGPQEAPPLDGIRVLDFSHVLAGPFSTRLLADLGAEVLKVESSVRPDRLGATKVDLPPHRRQDRPPFFLNVNRNKRSITLNLKTPGGRGLATRLASKADVLVENFSAGVMERLGLGYADLQPLNPALIFVSMSGFGHSGPRRDWISMNMTLQAYSGLLMVTGAPGDLPTSISNSWNDYIGGLHASFGVVEALAERERTGTGKHLDFAQLECSVATIAPLVLASAYHGQAPPRLGDRSTTVAPQGCYRCAGEDDWCTLSVQTDEQWQALAQALGSPDWASAPQFADVHGRLEHHDELDERLEAWSSQYSSIEVERRLKASGVPAERMRRINEIVGAPDAGDAFHWMEDPPDAMLVTGLPMQLDVGGVAPPAPAPRLGEHTQQALQEWLGMSAEETAPFVDEGALT